jgi:hypothetical protein
MWAWLKFWERAGWNSTGNPAAPGIAWPSFLAADAQVTPSVKTILELLAGRLSSAPNVPLTADALQPSPPDARGALDQLRKQLHTLFLQSPGQSSAAELSLPLPESASPGDGRAQAPQAPVGGASNAVVTARPPTTLLDLGEAANKELLHSLLCGSNQARHHRAQHTAHMAI